MSEQDEILFTEIPGPDGNLGKITLNRPQALNAINLNMAMALVKQLKLWEKNPQIKAVIIIGAGDKAFCAGGDVRNFYEEHKNNLAGLPQFFWHEYRMNHQIFQFPKPYIAFMHGITMGGGAGVSMHGSHRIGAETLRFAMPETGIGFHPDTGASYFLPRCLDKTGVYLGLTGNIINAADAQYTGIIDAIVPQQQFDNLIATLAETTFSADACASISQIIASFAPARAPEPAPLWLYRRAIDRCFSCQSMEETMAALQRENTPWAQATTATLLSRSPTSLKVTLRELQQSAGLTFAACMQMEYRTTSRFAHGHDFYEGVRAAIIDKDKSPRWQPQTLAEVPDKEVDAYFAPLSQELNFLDEQRVVMGGLEPPTSAL